jgi:ketosteroid isomerase-like protein
MTPWNVVISGQGRAGTITYTEASTSIQFNWELGAHDVVAIISGPPPQEWNSRFAWAAHRRREILGRVAQEAIRLRAPTAEAEVADGETTILLKTHAAQKL